MRIDAKDEMVVLGNNGLQSSLPKIVRGGLAYAPETQTLTGTFDKVRKKLALGGWGFDLGCLSSGSHVFPFA